MPLLRGSAFIVVFAVVAIAETVVDARPLGASAAAVALFEIILAATSLFNHGNLRVPRPIDRVLRWLVVTPAMHAVHHSAERSDRNSNFGFSVPWWDRLLGTYRERPVVNPPLTGMPGHQSDDGQTLRWMLVRPFRSMDRRRPADRQVRQEAA
jgi:sterol desaturase/sphingolipid hydroxylase (fatty acid hydroxylase superfamily)